MRIVERLLQRCLIKVENCLQLGRGFVAVAKRKAG